MQQTRRHGSRFVPREGSCGLDVSRGYERTVVASQRRDKSSCFWFQTRLSNSRACRQMVDEDLPASWFEPASAKMELEALQQALGRWLDNVVARPMTCALPQLKKGELSLKTATRHGRYLVLVARAVFSAPGNSGSCGRLSPTQTPRGQPLPPNLVAFQSRRR